jgi:hypothetical protein
VKQATLLFFSSKTLKRPSRLSQQCKGAIVAAFALLLLNASPAQPQILQTRDASRFPGASIVEKLQAAIRDCSSDPCEIYLPAGTYDTSPISTWKNHVAGNLAGVVLPSNVEIRGAGQGRTVIRVARAAQDPPAVLFTNAESNARNIRLREMTITWNDKASSYDFVSILICRACHQLELDHLTLEGNANKLVNLLDCTSSSIHDNLFALRSTGYGHGDNALSVNRFDAAVSVGTEAAVVRDNRFVQTGDQRIFSMLIISQNGVYVHDNIFEAHLPSSSGNATAIESGQDNLARLPENVKISHNIFHGSSIAYGGVNNSEISGNFFDHGDIYIALQSGSTASISGLNISGNELHFGTISIGGLEHTSTGRFLITQNRVFDGSIGTGSSSLIRDVEVTYNNVRNSARNNGIDCNACSIIKGNIVREVGQNAPSDMHAGYLIGGIVDDVSDNVYLDDQHNYDTGTICSVPSPSSKQCLSSTGKSGASRWIFLQGGEWGFGWTNRMLFTDRANLPIHAFVNSNLIELDDDAVALPASTRYHLYSTTFNAFELNNCTIERFADNLAISTAGFRHAAIQENGTVLIRNLSGNALRPYKCAGKCAWDYRSTITAPEQ